MKVEIFPASGFEDIKRLDSKINGWLASGVEVKHISTAICQVGDAAAGERYQHFVVKICYEDLETSK